MTGVATGLGDRPDSPAARRHTVSRRRAEPRRGVLRDGVGRSAGWLLTLAGLLVLSLLSIVIGTHSVTVGDVVAGVTGTPTNDVERVVRHVRVPRTLTGVLAGVTLAVAGVVMQGLTRNPLAGPGILGVTSGASLAVVLGMSVLGVVTTAGYVWFAFVGAALAATFVYVLGSLGFGGATPVKLALAGAAFTALAGSVTTGITLLDKDALDDFRFWAVGSLTRADDASLLTVLPFVLVGLVAATATTRTLNALALGDDMARSLGTRLWTIRLIGAASVVLLAGSATAVAGPIGFVGLVVPHVARMIVGSDYRWVMAWSVVLAPCLLLLADIIGRVIAQPQQIPVGIVTAFAGVPFFLYLVRSRKVSEL